jgi:hypothetical protein
MTVSRVYGPRLYTINLAEAVSSGAYEQMSKKIESRVKRTVQKFMEFTNFSFF